MAKIIKRLVDAAEPRSEKWIVWDDELAGFGLAVMPTGVKSYILRYRTVEARDRRLTIGRHGVLTPDQARAKAREILVAVNTGADPLAERRNRRLGATINDLFDRYEEDHLPRLSRRTAAEQKRLITKHLRPEIGVLKVESFNTQDARRVHFLMRKTPRQANSVIVVLSKALALAEEWGMRAEGLNPCSKVKKYPETVRDRFLAPEEIVRLGSALAEAETVGLPWNVDESNPRSKHLAKIANRTTLVDPTAVAVVKVLLLTGARLSEISELEWHHVDLQGGMLALPYQKGRPRKPHPVATAALDVLAHWGRVQGSRWVFPRVGDPSRPIAAQVLQRAWQRIRRKAGLDDVHLHDLRHTFGTTASRSGGNAFQVRDVLRHADIAMSARYVNADVDPMRALTEVVGSTLLASLTSGSEHN
ncbi:tyrosine-type recombinase/integrase [Telmatospirillum sp.]|uniref:tyrosine-type recombinase/integrase n=1 Tax=Telmatospirillum sp. TaxID=2079197 RepID=UPI00284FC924|nr:tyrosine-type recombinase/integrase [Telmatospirillum sp.]MDR3439027.1 tyrosine-type recombinase/integrase [Telmatospirillum sp.]